MTPAFGIDRPHAERMDDALLGCRQPLDQGILAVFIHQEADGAAVHAVDRLAGIHKSVQGLQHQAIPAERDDNVGMRWVHIAVAEHQHLARRLASGIALLTNAMRSRRWLMASHALARTVVGGKPRRAARHTPQLGFERVVFVYTTYPSVVEAEKAGNALVGSQLAACVNILPGMISVYRWEGAVERAQEAVMIVKTRASLAEAVRAGVKASHPYDTPAIVVLPVESVDQRYFAWIVAETEPAA